MRSLRRSFLTGLVAVLVPSIASLCYVVYRAARHELRGALDENLRVRAYALSRHVVMTPEGPRMEEAEAESREYRRRDSGAYFEVFGPRGELLHRSTSLGGKALPDRYWSSPWKRGPIDLNRLREGPGGAPCRVATLQFEALRENDETGADPPPPPLDDSAADDSELDPARRCRVIVALDATSTEAKIDEVQWFLVLAGGVVLLVAIAAGRYLTVQLLRPIEGMSAAAAALDPESPITRLDPHTAVLELDGLARNLNTAFDRLAAALARQRAFTADASHELRTPVSVVLGNAELLLSRPRTEAQYREGLERQVRVARQMTALIDDLLTLARDDAGRLDLRREEFDLGELVGEVADDLQQTADASGLTVERALRPGVLVSGDRIHMRRVVSNLLSNALKFTPSGGRVTLAVDRDDDGARMVVADTGPGIAPDLLPRVFERFVRGDPSRAANRGTGLGLAVVASLVRAHGGSVVAESAPGAGATFTVRLPAAGRASPSRA